MTQAPILLPEAGQALSPKALMQRIAPLVQAQRWAELREQIAPYLHHLSQTPEGAYIAGLMFMAEENASEAMRWMQRCLELNPQHQDALFHLASIFLKHGHAQNAFLIMKEFIEAQPNHVRALQLMGKILCTLDRIELAESMFKRAYALDNQLAFIELDFAICYLALGEHAQCRSWIAKAFKRYPDNALVIFNYGFIEEGKLDDATLKRLKRLFNRGNITTSDRAYIGFTIAKAYEARGLHDVAFDYYESANREQARIEVSRIEQHTETIEATLKVVQNWNCNSFEGEGCPDRGAIFVVGLPRSGTTLVQQMLASHSQITGAGELAHLSELALQRAPTITGKPFPQSLNAATGQQLAGFGAAYMKALRSYGSTPFIVDKMPGNLFHIPFIRRVLPQAVVIVVHRDPIDICWSMYRQRFSGEHGYSYDFEAMADYVALNLRILDAYRPIFGTFIKEVRYEEIIATPQAAARQLIEWCGLTWEEGVMDFHKAKQKIRTASVLQVNKPIYTDARRSWDPVKHRLKPLIEALHARGIETCVSRGEVEL